MMYQAKRGHAPLVVIAGESGVRYDAMEAQMWADLVAMAEPVTKWATRVVDPTSLLRVLRRAIKEAGTPPMGPVFVSLPMDVLDAINEEPVVPTSMPSTRVVPVPEDIDRVAGLLVGASHPMIIAGDGVAYSGGEAELTRVAELLGAEVWGADWSEANMDHTHPLFRGMLGHMFGDHSQGIVTRADAVLIVGTYVFPEVFPALQGMFAPGAPVIHIDLDAHEIAKNFPVDVGLVADPQPTLAAVADALDGRLTSDQREAAAARVESLRVQGEQERADQMARDESFTGTLPLHASLFAAELARRLPEGSIMFDEALTTSPDLTRYLRPTIPGTYFLTRGGSLGVGIPGAIGIKVAHPDRTVVGFTGDGGSMYTIQALWTAARHGIGAKFVVCNNQSYELLKLNITEYWKERGMPQHDFPASFDLSDPPIRFDELARALGVAAVRVEKPEDIGPAIEQMLADDKPFLVDLVIASQVPHTRAIAGADRA
jgi:benzoylformate decarboxylase